jgi:hypothetical protein
MAERLERAVARVNAGLLGVHELEQAGGARFSEAGADRFPIVAGVAKGPDGDVELS